MEFMSMGVPVVVSETTIDRYYFDDLVVKCFKAGDESSLAEALCATCGFDPVRELFQF